MKKTIYPIIAFCALVLNACNKDVQNLEKTEEPGTIELNITSARTSSTKALDAYTVSQTYETRINNIQALVFGSDGKINCHKDLGTSMHESLSTTAGEKTVYVVINGPDMSSVSTLAEMEEEQIDLSANSTDASKGFVMTGKSRCTVSGHTECTITVSRLAARIALKSVTNALPVSYGAIEIKRIFLANVSGTTTLSGSELSEEWYNKEGRKDESPLVESHIIDGAAYQASCPELTFNEIGATIENGEAYGPSTPHLLYCYANSSDTVPSGFNSAFVPQKSVLVTVVEIEGKTYYYPVVLDRSASMRNTASTIGLTISSIGATDPNEPISKGSLAVSISVDDWQIGATYEENI